MALQSVNRRNFIRTVSASTIGTLFAKNTIATNSTEFIISGSENSKAIIENNTEYMIKNDLSAGVYSVIGPAQKRSHLEQTAGISNVVSNFRITSPKSVNRTDISPASISLESQNSSSNPLFKDEQWDKRQINAFDSHDYATGNNTKIAIVDTGIDDQHPDHGNVNVSESLSFINGQEGEHIGDIGSHGTHTAGVAAATGEKGIVGVAPDAELVSIRIFGPRGQGGSFEDLLLAVKYSAEIGVDVINLSLGSGLTPPQENSGGIRGTFNPVCQAAVNEGTIITTSSGNGGERYQQGKFAIPSSIPSTLSVSATGRDEELAFYSSFGNNVIDVAAPGGGKSSIKELSFDDFVLSTVPSGWRGSIGTSVAAAQVTGLAALVREIDRNRKPKEVLKSILHAAGDTNSRGDLQLGAGQINALETVTQI